jgi:hypothetical protein
MTQGVPDQHKCTVKVASVKSLRKMSAIIMNHVLFEVYASATGYAKLSNYENYQKYIKICDPNCEPFTFLDHSSWIVIQNCGRFRKMCSIRG